ncbi:MAG TPA: DUF3137 domain-containing protein [Candidatus Acidoferrales bacterium]|nr:DUF3137 domain-containing protein [Candidatus Acidoferrales bacterium]
MLLFFGIIALVLVAGAVSYLLQQQRARDIGAFAAAHGLTAKGKQWDLGDCGFSLFRQGNRRSWRNVMQGTWNGLPSVYCDYTYVVQAGKNTETFSFSNVVSALGMEIPWVTVSPRGILGTLAEKSVGAPGVRFESIDFNDRFDVRSSDDAFAVELIDAQMIETLLSLDHAMHVVFGPDSMMVYTHRRPVVEVPPIFDATVTLSQRIPALVHARYGQPSTPIV